jgi:hypothetical protein
VWKAEARSMGQLRVRFVFNPGRVGSPMDKLGEFSSQTEKFLRSLSIDLGIETKKGQWLALHFADGSFEFDAELSVPVSDAEAARGREALSMITGEHPLDACNKGIVGHVTVAEFARIGRPLDFDEKFRVGIYSNGEATPSEWREVDYRKTAEIRQLLDTPLISYGSVQGIVHAWHIGASPGFFQMRELSSGSLVHCFYRGDLYAKVHQATHVSNTVIHVYGDIRWDRVTNAIITMDAKDLEITEALPEQDFERLFGSMPDFTGTMSTADYIDWLRGDAE